MNWLQQIRDWIKPSTVTCNDDLENHLQAKMMEDQFDAHIPEKKHKVPNFQHLLNPILMVSMNPDLIKGFRFQFGLPLSEYFLTSHAWNLPNSGTVEDNPNPMMPPQGQQKPTYTFTTQLVRDIRGQQPYTIMVGKADNEGKVDAIFIKKLTNNLTSKINASFQSSNVEQGMVNAELEYQSKDALSVAKITQGFWGFSHMQRVHPSLLLGFDYTNLTAHRIAAWSYAFKVFINKHSLFGNYMAMNRQYNLGYLIPIKRGTHFVAHYKFDSHDRSSTTILGLKQSYAQSEILATISSKGQITTSFNFRNPSYSLRLCGVVDYMKQKYSFGYGITLGQSM